MFYDLAIAWNWEYDGDFVARLAAACGQHGLALLQVTPRRLKDVLARLACGDLNFHMLYDRASDIDDAYLPLVEWAARRQLAHINEYHTARRAWDKATMHLEFIQAGLDTPYTIILPPHAEQADVPIPDLAPLGRQFSIKPAHGGGGSGVVNRATAWSQVRAARAKEPADKYLLQEWITPACIDGRRAWFRPIYACGQIFVNWWNDQTHVYKPAALDEEKRLGLGRIREMVRVIARICQLEIFSTEIALSDDGRWLSVDYVNDPIDLRLQSRAPESVPDSVVADMAQALAMYVLRRVRPVVRVARKDDAQAVTALLAELGRPDQPTLDVFDYYLTHPDMVLLVAELDGRVVGTLAGAFRLRLNQLAPELWVADLCVTTAARGYGAGKALMQHAIDLARARKCFRIYLESGYSRQTAHKLYQSLGFDKVGNLFILPL